LHNAHCHHLHTHAFPTRRSSDLAPAGSTLSVQVENPQPVEVPQVAPQHAYALSVTRHPEKTSASAMSKSASAKEELKSAQQWTRSEEHTSELQSRVDLVCRLLLE